MSKLTLLCIFLTLTITSCSDTLSKEEAQEVILNNYDFSDCRVRLYGDKTSAEFRKDGSPSYSYSNYNLSVFKKIEQQGYARVVSSTSQGGYTTYTMKLNDRGQKFYNNKKYTLTYEKFGEITGISQDGDKASVMFTIINERSPFFDLVKKNKCPKSTITEEVQLKKFDTGWQLSKE